MVVGEEAAVLPPPQPMPPSNIDNIMSGIGNTGTVKMNNHRKKLRQRFDIIKKLGQGTYGKVQLGINKETGQEVAIKTIKKCKIETEADLVRIRREVQIMSSVQHPNIIHIYEVFENREKMVLVMEFAAGGELYDYLSERKVLSEEEARRVFRQIATAVYYCHKHKICHRDLKLENILLDEHGSAKIADFGLSNVFDDRRLLATFCGSPLYASPEIVKGTPYQGPEVDCWSLGVLLYTLVYGAMPFDGSNFKRLVKQISQGDYYEPKKASAASPLIREMLTVCPKRRATIESICSHWWVNEGYEESCLDLAEELANQTPVRLDVLLSLTPQEITAEQLVVPTPGVQESKSSERVPRSHSVGSVIDLGNTEAERRIIDMVAQGGEAALMPSPTRTLTPVESPAQTKRKLEQTISTENATGAVKKKEKAIDVTSPSKTSIPESMEVEPIQQQPTPTPTEPSHPPPLPTTPPVISKEKDLENIEKVCDELLEDKQTTVPSVTVKIPTKKVVKKKIISKKTTEEPIKEDVKVQDSEKQSEVQPEKDKKSEEVPIDNKTSTSSAVTTPTSTVTTPTSTPTTPSTTSKPSEKRKSRIFETAEKLQSSNQTPSKSISPDKTKKFGGVGSGTAGNTGGGSVCNFKKEFERKASLTGLSTNEIPTPEKMILSQGIKIGRKTSLDDSKSSSTPPPIGGIEGLEKNKLNDSKGSITNFSLEEARRSMENSIALLNQAKNESSKELDQLCAKTENVSVSDMTERERKLRNAREIIGNAIQPGRLCMGVRKPPVPFGINGRSISGSVIPPSSGYEKKPLRVQIGNDLPNSNYTVTSPEDPLQQRLLVATLDEKPELEETKTSRAEITLKSATLPRRKPTKSEVKVDIEPKPERSMRFSTEMQHHIPDLRSAPIRENPYSPLSSTSRANSLEPSKDVVMPMPRPPFKAGAMPYRSGSLSRQSTNDSDTDTTQIQTSIGSTSTLGTGSDRQPIKKSPREFIIPIAVEGGGYITPRAGSLEPSDLSSTTTSFSSKLGRPTRRIGSLLNEKDFDDDSPFPKLTRHTSLGKENETEEPRFHAMHRLRSSRPVKRTVQDPNDSASSGDDDDEDGFEILTAENLFSTLLQRVRALTNRLNVNDAPGFPASRLMSNFNRQPPGSFWHHDPFGSNLNKSSSSWRHSVSRDLGSDIDSMFNRSGATLPRGTKFKTTNINSSHPGNQDVISKTSNTTTTSSSTGLGTNGAGGQSSHSSNHSHEKLDLDDLDLSRLRLTKKDLETLSSLTPNLPKQIQEQLLAQLPPNQARKLSRTFSMQNNSTEPSTVKPYKRSLSSGREIGYSKPLNSNSLNRSESVEKNPIYRRSLSKGRYDSEKPSRSSSRCRDSIGESENSMEYYSNLPPISSSCISPPPISSANDQQTIPQRRRSTSKRISRFLRPDFFDTPREESIYVKDNLDRDPESRRLLREIRERSRERSSDRYGPSERLTYIMEKYGHKPDDYLNNRYARHSSIDERVNAHHSRENSIDIDNKRRCSLTATKDGLNHHLRISAPKEIQPVQRENNSSFTDKILNELQSIARLNKQSTDDDDIINNNNNTEVMKTKKLNKSKSRDKLSDKTDSDDFHENLVVSNNTNSNTKNEKINDMNMVTALTKEIDSISPLNLPTAVKTRESRLARPKSYPNKSNDKLTIKKSSDKLNNLNKDEEIKSEISDISENVVSETTSSGANSKLIRPKSYPNSKLTPPKELSVCKKSNDEKEKTPPNISTSSSTVVTTTFSVSSSSTVAPTSTTSTTTTTAKITGKVVKEKIANGDATSVTTTSTSTTTTGTKPVKKIIKTVKKTIKKDKTTENGNVTTEKIDKKETSKVKSDENKEKEIKEVDAKKEEIKDVKETRAKSKEKELIKEKDSEKDKEKKEPSPEKKTGKGFLYSIGQKFEKFRENTKTKEKKNGVIGKEDKPIKDVNLVANQNNISSTTTTTTTMQENDTEKKKKSKPIPISNNVSEDVKNIKIEKRSNKIDAMIRNLREMSVPRSPVITESRLLKRAVSVEDMSGNYNKCGVNKVLGLFKKYEKDTQNLSKIKNTKSTSNVESIENLINERSIAKKDISSSAPQRKLNPYKGAKSDTILSITEQIHQNNNNLNRFTKIPKYGCNECLNENGNNIDNKQQSKRHSTNIDLLDNYNAMDEKEKLKNKRHGLMLDFTKLDNITSPANFNPHHHNHINNNNIIMNNNNNNNNNNNSHSYHDINRNHMNDIDPTYENLANYSSDFRSPYDECASTSTLLSPTDERELYFDNWSICSDDHTRPTSSPLISSKYSRSSNPGTASPIPPDSNESIVDRIRRKSFYSRFNEKKPKRVSTIVGPAAKEFYRERDASVTRSISLKPTTNHNNNNININNSSTKPLDYKRSFNEHAHSKNTHEYYRPIKTNTFDSVYDLSDNPNKLNNEYKSTKSVSSINNYQGPKTSSSITSTQLPIFDSEYSNKYSSTKYDPTKRSSAYYDSPGLPYSSSSSSSTYNPRPTTIISTPSSSSSSSYINGTSNLETYATLGRKIRPYEQRSMSMLNTLTPKVSKINNTHIRDPHLTTDFGSISRRFRNPLNTKSSGNT